ncbi:MAG: OprO/OprP family phosphate-selective porin, partial [Gammaproteobacteria bacterium]|nr:OprO/OprP family phosphate-selective porin [Gammaproteobacteria bacterium]
GALELAARFSNLDLSDGGLDGGEMDIWSLGFNWFLTADASIGINYRYIELDRFGVVGESHGLNTRLMLQID